MEEAQIVFFGLTGIFWVMLPYVITNSHAIKIYIVNSSMQRYPNQTSLACGAGV